MKILCARSCALLIVVLAIPQLLLANPSTKDPDVLLRIRPGEGLPGDHVKPDYEAINGRYQKAKAGIDELWQKYEAKTLVLADARKFGPVYRLQAQLERDATLLKLRSEASGWDLALRVAELDRRMTQMVKVIVAIPNFPAAQLGEQLQRDHAIGLKRLPQIEGLMKRKQFVQAEGELYEIIDSMVLSAMWMPMSDNTAFFRPFNVPLEEAIRRRRELVIAELKPVIAQCSDFVKLQAELTAAATSIAESGQGAFADQMLTGPDWLAAWHERSPKLQAASQRAVMAQIATDQIDTERPPQGVAMMQARHEFAINLPKYLAAIIEADARRTNGLEALALYKKYVAAAAAIVAAGPRAELQSALEPALNSLAMKAGIEAELSAYRSATDPLLAWQRFMARSRVKALGQGSPGVADWCSRVLSRQNTTDNTIVTEPMGSIAQAKVISSADLVLLQVFASGPSGPTIFSDVVPVNAAKSRWVARYNGRVFGLAAAPPVAAWQAETSRLELGLLTIPPTLDAAVALASAKMGACETVGGAVDQVTLEPLLTRFITLPDEAATLLPLGPLTPEPNNPDTYGDSLSVRCDMLKPTWYQHECFVLVP